MTPLHHTNDILADPFLERAGSGRSIERWILGARFRFTSASDALLTLVDAAYGGLPDHVLPGALPLLQVELRLTSGRRAWVGDEPPSMNMQSGAGLLYGVMDADNHVLMAPEAGRALIVVSEDMLAFPYHLRYELIEFAVFTLAARVQRLIPLHGACLGRGGRGVLIVGGSGAGKSTLALHGALDGLDLLAEDAVFVHPRSLRATGVPNYLHVRHDGLAWVDDDQRHWICSSPVIRRRSGTEKFEVDLRKGGVRLAGAPLELAGIVFVSPPGPNDVRARLRSINTEDMTRRLAAEQPYAASQDGWGSFLRELTRIPVCELVRGPHPGDSLKALMPLLD